MLKMLGEFDYVTALVGALLVAVGYTAWGQAVVGGAFDRFSVFMLLTPIYLIWFFASLLYFKIGRGGERFRALQGLLLGIIFVVAAMLGDTLLNCMLGVASNAADPFGNQVRYYSRYRLEFFLYVATWVLVSVVVGAFARRRALHGAENAIF